MKCARSSLAMSVAPFLHSIQVSAEAVEARLQDLQLRGHPLAHLIQRLLLQPIDPRLRLLAVGDQPAFAQYAQVPGDRGAGDFEPAGNIASAALASRQHGDDLASGRVGKGFIDIHALIYPYGYI